MKHWLAVFSVVILAACSTADKTVTLEQSDEISPENYAEYIYQKPAIGKNAGISTPHPLATKAAADILKQGGNAVDAAITASVMLTLVEPLASGIGGGGFMVMANNGTISTIDGRETAPTGSTADMFLENDQPMEFYDAVVGGKGVGIPGLLRMLEKAHQQQGSMPWADLIMPVVQQARKGYAISSRLHHHLTKDPYLKNNPAAAAYFYQNNQPYPVGHILKNPQLATVLEDIARNGADTFYNKTAKNIITAVKQTKNHPKNIPLSDFQNYKAINRTPVCDFYRQYKVCGMAPPSAGGIVTIQALKFLERFDLKAKDAATQVHLIAEATKRAYADRNAYIADPEFVTQDLMLLVNPGYLKHRGRSITTTKNSGIVAAGSPYLDSKKHYTAFEPTSTSHISIIKDGIAVSLTTSIENLFGSRVMVDGFLLNNQLTDFAFNPINDNKPVNNAVAPGKRPRSSMSPTIILDRITNKPVMAIGSPGGSRITPYVIRAILAELGEIPAIASSGIVKGNIVDRNTGTLELEEGVFSAKTIQSLKNKGHNVKETILTSGVNIVKFDVASGTYTAKTDPRREGKALAY